MNMQSSSSILVTLVVITYEGKALVLRCLDSISHLNYQPLEVLVVDNGSSDGTVESIQSQFPDVRVIVNEKNLMLGEARNIGIREAKGEYVFLIDNDNVLDPEVVTKLYQEISSKPEIGMIGPVAYYLSKPERIWSAGSYFNMMTSLAHHLNEKDLLSVSGPVVNVVCIPNAFMVRRSAINQVGYFDSKRYPMSYDEGDMGKRMLAAGYQVCVVKAARIYHDIPDPSKGINGLLRRLHFGGTGQSGKIKAYLHGRNRILFMHQYAGRKFWIYLLVFFGPINLAYCLLILLNRRFDLLVEYLKGIKDSFKVISR